MIWSRDRYAPRLVRRVMALFVVCALPVAMAGRARDAGAGGVAQDATPECGFTVVAEYPHDPDAFTQGLVHARGALYEGTGLWGRSTLRRVDLESGTVLQSHSLPSRFFGEGITVIGDKIIQLTWQSRVGFVYDRGTFQNLEQFAYETEGWGLTHDGQHLIMSDGTSTLYFMDPQTFEEVSQLPVHDHDGPVTRLNELEYLHGEIYANVWQSDRIARIDPLTGEVRAWINLEGLLTPGELEQPVDVLNGIAYDASDDRLLVTGKLWPKLFHIDVLCTRSAVQFLPLISTSSVAMADLRRPPQPHRMTHVMGAWGCQRHN